MTDSQRPKNDNELDPLIPRGFGLPGAVMLSWMIAGGVLAGGFLVAYATFTEQVAGHGILYTAGGFYLIGSAIGAVLGGALGMFGRPAETAARKAFHDQLIALLYALPVLFLAFILTGWIAMTVVAISLRQAVPLIGVSLAYLAGFAAVAMAVRFGWFGVRQAWQRYSTRTGPRKSLRLVWVVEEEEEEGEGEQEQEQEPDPTPPSSPLPGPTE